MVKKDCGLTAIFFGTYFAIMAGGFSWMVGAANETTAIVIFIAYIVGGVIGFIYPRGRDQNPQDVQ